MFSGFLRKEREKRGISQERLCRGVCAVSALSRYENGERIPDRLLMNTLIERLGKSSDKLVTMISCQEYAYFEWKSKVKETLRYTGNRQWERGGDFFSGGGDPVDKSRFYRKDCC